MSPDAQEGLLGWATIPLLMLDERAPGLIRRVLTVSPMRRQAIFAVVAEHTCSPVALDDEGETALARVLLRDRAREILSYAFGDVPDGLIGTLERIGYEPLASSSGYLRLRGAFARGAPPHLAEALRDAGEIDAQRLKVLDALDPRWVHSTTLKRIENTRDARDFNACLAFVQQVNSKATDEVIAEAIARLPPQSDLPTLVQRFIRRADRFPPNPIEESNELRRLSSVRSLIEAARRYRNCLASKIEAVLVGQVAFAEFRGEAILELHPLSGGFGWLLADVHVARNALVPEELRAAAVHACTNIGIPAVERGGGELRPYARFTYHMGLFA